jgi:hypothetical protein
MISDATFQSFPTLIQLMIIRNGLGGIIIEQDGRHNVFGHSGPWYVAAVTLCCVLGLAMAYPCEPRMALESSIPLQCSPLLTFRAI